MTVINVDEYGM